MSQTLKNPQLIKITWIDAWIENELTESELKLLKKPRCECSLIGWKIWQDKVHTAIAAEKVVSNDDTVSWRAVTIIPTVLITHTTILED